MPYDDYWAKCHVRGLGVKAVGYYFIHPTRGRMFQPIVDLAGAPSSDTIARLARETGYTSDRKIVLGAHEEIDLQHLPADFAETLRAEFEQGDTARGIVLRLTAAEISSYGLPTSPLATRAQLPESMAPSASPSATKLVVTLLVVAAILSILALVGFLVYRIVRH